MRAPGLGGNTCLERGYAHSASRDLDGSHAPPLVCGNQGHGISLKGSRLMPTFFPP